MTFGNSRESESQILYATISENLKINTPSDISGLNRDDTRTKGPVHKSSHKFSLALPIVDWKELGAGLERIGMTARDINEKTRRAFESAKNQAVNKEDRVNIEEIKSKYEDIAEKIEKADITEAEKVELMSRLIFIMAEDEVNAKQYLVYAEGSQTYSLDGTTLEKEEIRIEAVEMKDNRETLYKTKDGVILGDVNSEGEYDRFALMVSNDLVNDIKELKVIKSKGAEGSSLGLSKALFAGKLGLRVVPVKLESAAKEGHVEIGQIQVDTSDEYFKDITPDNLEQILAQIGEAFAAEMWAGAKRAANEAAVAFNTPRVQGSLEVAGGVGEVLLGAGLAGATWETGIGFYEIGRASCRERV